MKSSLRLRNAYLAAENRILRNQIKARRVPLTDAERKTLAEIGQKLGRQALEEIAAVAKPDTILGWHRTLVAQTCGSSQPRKALGRPRMDQELEALVVRMARENRSWGYDRIVGALANLGYRISDQTVGNILKRHGIPPVHERKTTMTWKEFIRIHMDVLVATDFFTSEVGTWFTRVIASLLLIIHVGRRTRPGAGVTVLFHERWRLPIPPRCSDGHADVERWRRSVIVTGCHGCFSVVHGSDNLSAQRSKLMVTENAYTKTWARSCACLWSITIRYGMDRCKVDNGSAGR